MDGIIGAAAYIQVDMNFVDIHRDYGVLHAVTTSTLYVPLSCRCVRGIPDETSWRVTDGTRHTDDAAH